VVLQPQLCRNKTGLGLASDPKRATAKGSIGRAFAVRIRTENQNQASFCPFAPHEISVLVELPFGRLRYPLTDVPPQPNSPPEDVFALDPAGRGPAKDGLTANGSPEPRNVRARFFPEARAGPTKRRSAPSLHKRISESTSRVVVFQDRRSSHLCYTPRVDSQSLTRVKLNRVFFPRRSHQARSLGCGFAGL